MHLGPAERPAAVEILNPFSALQVVGDKQSVLDVRVTDQAGRRYDVEMMCYAHPALAERIVYYACRMVREQLGESDPYTRLRPVIVLVFTTSPLVPAEPRYHTTFRLRDGESAAVLSPLMRIDIVELPKYDKPAGAAASLEEMWIS
ncbi:MAG: Rpn family recombination-promoting nuclease/putative transposase, partial [Candidatus Schekmanbacteria bacterium]|nr:Rpn family recombination-promoting nuclease/putative transposase [Candidatus Schekmanbacteria bacterium]